MAIEIFSLLQHLKCQKIKNNYRKHLHKLVSGQFYVITRFSHSKIVFSQRQNVLKEGYMSQVKYFDKKYRVDIENHCGYMISILLAKSPFVKTI